MNIVVGNIFEYVFYLYVRVILGIMFRSGVMYVFFKVNVIFMFLLVMNKRYIWENLVFKYFVFLVFF